MTQELTVQNNSIFKANNFSEAKDMATYLSGSDLVPEAYRTNEKNGDKSANIVLALEMAERTKTSPFAVMQNMHVISGKPAWSSQFIISMINSWVGINTLTPDTGSTLHVSGKTKTINFQMTSGATSGYILTSDAIGNASWELSSGGTDTNTFVTGFTYDDINTFTISDNLGSAFTASINVLSATTISGGTL